MHSRATTARAGAVAVLLGLASGALPGDGRARGEAGPELVAPGIVSTGDDEAHATLSPDGRRLDYRELVDRLRAPGNGLRDIYRIALDELDLGPACGGPP